LQIEKASEMGFCTGVRRAIDILERTAREIGPLETLGPVVHNQQVVDRLAQAGIHVAEGVDELQGNVLAVSSHGVSLEVWEEIKRRGLQMVDTTCPFVRRAQVVARRLVDAGFFVIIFGEEGHPEVHGVLGWTRGKGVATLDLPKFEELPRRIGILSQTTQSFASFARFVAEFVQSDMASFSELRVVNTVCYATRKRQQAALELAERVDVMVVVGGRSSANTKRLAEICSSVGVETHKIETAAEIDSAWLREHYRVGVTAGASTPDYAIEEVVARLRYLSQEDGGDNGAG